MDIESVYKVYRKRPYNTGFDLICNNEGVIDQFSSRQKLDFQTFNCYYMFIKCTMYVVQIVQGLSYKVYSVSPNYFQVLLHFTLILAHQFI